MLRPLLHRSTANTHLSTLGLVLALCMISSYSAAQSAPAAKTKPTLVGGQIVSYDNFVDLIHTTGTTTTPDQVSLTAQVTSLVDTVHFVSGQQVKKGDVMLSLNNDKITADLNATKLRIRQQENDLKRLLSLKKSGHVQKQQIESAKTDLAISKQTLNRTQSEYDDHNVIAPFGGIVGLRQVSIGQLVKPGDALLSLTRFHPMYLDFNLAERYLPALRQLSDDANVEVSDQNSQAYQAAILAIDNQIDPATRSVAVRASIDNPEATLLTGQLMRVKFSFNPRRSLAVDEKALIQKARKHFVYVISNNTAVLTPVTIGKREFGKVEILDGLSEGDTVINEGLVKVKAGAAVKLAVKQ